MKRLTAVVISFVLATGCTRFMCKERAESHMPAPDRILVATTVIRDCGATTDFSTSVNLHRSDHGFNDDAGTIFVAMGEHHLSLKWADADHLSIQCEDCTRKQVSKTVTLLGKTDIKYKLPMIPEYTERNRAN
jgi:hypothetical protein